MVIDATRDVSQTAGGYGPPGGGYPPGGGGGYGGPPPGAPPGAPPGGYGGGYPPGGPPPQGGGGGGYGGGYPPGGAPPGGGYGGPPQGFGPPGGGFPPPGGPMMPGPGGDVNTTLSLVLSIISLLACCNPFFGIPAVVLSILAMNAKKAGDIEGARSKAKVSLILAIVGMALSMIGNTLYFIFRES